ncbi:hypothetical protein CASFOL_029251 [Castilleja foliolosa]|uniref:phosphopyruvate hydratase n=1 Tax=Castilleja foliolosa TaxID=1961234 RepID=A0ABD3CCQ6_9LAMI
MTAALLRRQDQLKPITPPKLLGSSVSPDLNKRKNNPRDYHPKPRRSEPIVDLDDDFEADFQDFKDCSDDEGEIDVGSIKSPFTKAVIKKKYGQDATNVGDEGGFAPNIQENKEGLELLKTAIEKAGYTGKVVIRMDVAASEFYGTDKTYDFNFKEENNNGSQKSSGDKLKDLYKSFVAEYPIVSIEDPFDQDDWEHYAKMTTEIGTQVRIVGDDLLVTNPKRVEKAVKEKSCNALLLKRCSSALSGAKIGRSPKNKRVVRDKQLRMIFCGAIGCGREQLRRPTLNFL